MAFIPTPNAARVVINWAKGAETFSYVFYATKPGFDINDQQALADGVDSVHNAVIKGYFSANVSYVNTTVYDARTIDGEIVVDSTSAGPCTGGTEALSLNNAVCVTLRTASRGRSARGRKYITGWGENVMTLGEYTLATQNNAVAYVNAIKIAMNVANWTMVIRSIQENNQPKNPAVVRAVIALQCRNGKVATQRRRVDRP